MGRELVLPARRPADLETLLAEVPELRLLVIDGAERPIRRPKDKDHQKKDCRGKKKARRKKNLLHLQREAHRVLRTRPAPAACMTSHWPTRVA